MEADLASERDSSAVLQAELQTLTDSNAALETDLASERDSSAALQAELQTLTEVKDALETDLAAEKDETAALQIALQTLTEVKTELEGKLASETETSDALRIALQTVTKAKTSLEADLASEKEAGIALETVLKTLAEANMVLEANLASDKETVSQLEAELETAALNNETLLSENAALQDRIAALEDSLALQNPVDADSAFLADLAAALTARWEVASEDVTQMTNQQLIDYFSMLVDKELDHLTRYHDVTLEDEHLNQYAHAYINALDAQKIAITQYYGKDQAAYEKYWITDGYYVRNQMIYRIHKEYGIDVPPQHMSELEEFVQRGLACDIRFAIEGALGDWLSNAAYTIEQTSSYAEMKPMAWQNTTGYPLDSLYVAANFFDSDGNVVNQCCLCYKYPINHQQTINTDAAYIDRHFSSVEFYYEFQVNTGMYADTYSGFITPNTQYAWNGDVLMNDMPQPGTSYVGG